MAQSLLTPAYSDDTQHVRGVGEYQIIGLVILKIVLN